MLRLTTISPPIRLSTPSQRPYGFNTRQYARWLVLRGRVKDDMGPVSELDRCHGSTASLRPAA
jgi:hypothetical protein